MGLGPLGLDEVECPVCGKADYKCAAFPPSTTPLPVTRKDPPEEEDDDGAESDSSE